jgi:hypothetical protein
MTLIRNPDDRCLLLDVVQLIGPRSSGRRPAPLATWTEQTGTLPWLVPSHLTRWHTYQHRDSIDTVFGTLEWSSAEALTPAMSPIVENGLK